MVSLLSPSPATTTHSLVQPHFATYLERSVSSWRKVVELGLLGTSGTVSTRSALLS